MKNALLKSPGVRKFVTESVIILFLQRKVHKVIRLTEKILFGDDELCHKSSPFKS